MTAALDYESVLAAPVTDFSPPPSRWASVTVLRPPLDTAAAAPIRLTKRGVAVLALVVVALGAALLWLAASSSPTAAPQRLHGPAAVTVHSGDTLWSIATRVAPDRDPAVEIARLRALNHLRGVAIMPGQVLRLT